MQIDLYSVGLPLFGVYDGHLNIFLIIYFNYNIRCIKCYISAIKSTKKKKEKGTKVFKRVNKKP